MAKESLSVDLAAFQWQHLHLETAARRLPALALCLALGTASGQPAAGAVACGAALSLGMAGQRQVRGSRLLAMSWTAATMAIAAWIGTHAGNSHWAAPLAIALGAFVFGLLTVYDENVGWIAMQGTLALTLATALPAHGAAAFERSAAILAGAAAQMAVLSAIWRFRGVSRHGDEREGGGKPGPLRDYEYHWEAFARSVRLRSAAFRYAARLALTMVLAVEAARYLPIRNGYWLPMTTLIVMKPDFYRTYSGGVQRVAGTLVGAGVASLLARLFHPASAWLVGLALAFAFLTLLLLKVNPTAFAAALTSFVVFMIATTGAPEGATTLHRLVNTALGCALALGSQALGHRHLLKLLGGDPAGEVRRAGAVQGA